MNALVSVNLRRHIAYYHYLSFVDYADTLLKRLYLEFYITICL